MKHLKDIPNQQGYAFIGITKDDQRIDCIVIKDVVGCHVIVNEYTKERIFHNLKGWQKR